MTVISEHNYLVLLKNAFSRVHMMLLWISWSHWYHHLYHTHTHARLLTEGLAASSDLLESGFSDGACQMADKKRESRKLVQQTHHALMTRRWQSTAGLTAPFTPRSTAREKKQVILRRKMHDKGWINSTRPNRKEIRTQTCVTQENGSKTITQ